MATGKPVRQDGLTAIQAAFVSAYLRFTSATEAYLAIHPQTERKKAASCGHRLLQRPEVQAAIQRRQAKLEAKAGDIKQVAINRMRDIIETGKDADACAATDRLARILGWNAPEKAETKTEIIITKQWEDNDQQRLSDGRVIDAASLPRGPAEAQEGETTQAEG